MRMSVVWVACLTQVFTSSLHAQSNTPAQRKACEGDVLRLCFWYVPNRAEIIGCMAKNRSQLSSECRRVFDAGMRQRGG